MSGEEVDEVASAIHRSWCPCEGRRGQVSDNDRIAAAAALPVVRAQVAADIAAYRESRPGKPAAHYVSALRKAEQIALGR